MRRSSTYQQPTSEAIVEWVSDGSDSVFSVCYPVSRRTAGFPRHVPKLREKDGGVSWEKLVVHLEDLCGKIVKWTSEQWIVYLMKTNDKQQFECCSDRRRHKKITTSSSRSFRRNQDRSKVAETPCRPLMDGRITFLTSDQSGIIVLLSTQVSLPEKAETSREDKRASLQQSKNRLCVSSVHYPFEEGEPRMLPYLLKWKKVHDARNLLKQKEYFSTNEILYHKKTLEPQAVPKVALQCKFARDRSGGSTDTTEAKLFRSIDVPRQHSSQSLGSARGDPSLTRHGET